MEPAILVENLYKKYSRKASEHLAYGLWDLLREISGRKRASLRKDEFYAVNDVSFDLQPGDTFALIGRNGSGKTTVLKMLNGLTKPDGGRITINGRVQALINLGAGFNDRLSGRENVYNSASLMGLGHRETTSLYDRIADFSELGDVLESPVGTYSSGMKARLGFSVAVHLNPDILLIDEILSVGDFAFQNKCFTRMEQLKKQGVTIVLVSHSHNKVVQLCERALWLHEGKPMHMGPSQDSVKAYLQFLEDLEQQKLEQTEAEQEPPQKQPERSTPKPKPAPVTKELDDPSFKMAVSEPRTTEPEIFLGPNDEELVLRGWYIASTAKDVKVRINDTVVDVQNVERPDVAELHPDAKVANGFLLHLSRGALERENVVEIQVDGTVQWSRTLIVEQDRSPTRQLVDAGIYGPVYRTEGLIGGVTGEILVDGKPSRIIPIHSNVTIRYEYTLLQPVSNLHMTLNFSRKDGLHVAAIPSLQEGLHKHIHEGHVSGEINIPDFDLVPGTYVIMMPICDGKKYLIRDMLLEFCVSGGGDMFWGIKSFQCEHRVYNDIENGSESAVSDKAAR